MRIIFRDLSDHGSVQEEELKRDNELEICRFIHNYPTEFPGVKFDSKVMSRKHAVITTKNGKFFIKDLNSSNGTFVNKKRLDPLSETEIFSDDILQFGVNIGVHNPVKTKIEIFKDKDQKHSSRGEDSGSVKDQLLKLNSIIDILRRIYFKILAGEEVLAKLHAISKSSENLQTLLENHVVEQREVEISLKSLLNELINEVIRTNHIQEDKQNAILNMIISKFTDVDCEEIEKNRPASPIVFYQDDDLNKQIEIFRESNEDDEVELRPKSILSTGSQRSLREKRSCKIISLPEILEFEDETHNSDKEGVIAEDDEDISIEVTRNQTPDDSDIKIVDSEDESEAVKVETRQKKVEDDQSTARRRSWTRKSEERPTSAELLDTIRKKIAKVEDKETTNTVASEKSEVTESSTKNVSLLEEAGNMTHQSLQSHLLQILETLKHIYHILNILKLCFQGVFFLCFLILTICFAAEKNNKMLEFW